MKLTFRRANIEDSNELRFIAEKDSKIPLQYDPEYTWSEQSIEAQIDRYQKQISTEDHFEVALDDDRIAGFHIVKKVPYPPNLWAGAIFTLWVDPKYRGKGIARKLKSRAEKWAREQNFSYLMTNVHTGNAQMLLINKNEGFEIIQHSMRKRL